MKRKHNPYSSRLEENSLDLGDTSNPKYRYNVCVAKHEELRDLLVKRQSNIIRTGFECVVLLTKVSANLTEIERMLQIVDSKKLEHILQRLLKILDDSEKKLIIADKIINNRWRRALAWLGR